jgi:hypothetical protein
MSSNVMKMRSALLALSNADVRTDRRKEIKEPKDAFLSFIPELTQIVTQYILLQIAAHTETECLSCSASYCTAYLLYKYCTNCTFYNWTVLTVITQATATCSAAQQHNTFTVQILYKLYSLQLNCTYSNYTIRCYMFSCTTAHKPTSWCLLQLVAAGWL